MDVASSPVPKQHAAKNQRIASNLSLFASSICVSKLPTDYVSFDIETTGLDPERDSILEIAAVKVVDGEVVDRFQTMVAFAGKIPREAQRVNHITKDMLVGAPSDADAVREFLDFCGSLCIMGYNVKRFDRRFIDAVCARHQGLASPDNWYDAIDLSSQALGGKRSLSDLCSMLEVQNHQAHRAMGDAMATHECYQAIREAILLVTTDARDFAVSDDGPLLGERMAFTGEGRIGQHEAMAAAAALGARLENNVTLKVTTLVNLSGAESRKTRKAQEYGLRTGVRTIGEDEFATLVGMDLPRKSSRATTETELHQSSSGTPGKPLGTLAKVTLRFFSVMFWATVPVYALSAISFGMQGYGASTVLAALACGVIAALIARWLWLRSKGVSKK